MKRAEPGWLVLVLAGIAAGIGSFLPFYTYDGGVDLTVWNRSLFPTATLIPVFVVLIGLEALFVLLMGHEPRSPFLNLTWSQARLAGSAFAILLALAFLVQGRAGGNLGSGYAILSLSTLASYSGAVLARRAELGRRREEVVTVRKVEHPWRAAFLRWRNELAEKAQAFAAGNPNPPVVQPVPDSPSTEPAEMTAERAEEQEEEEKEEKGEKDEKDEVPLESTEKPAEAVEAPDAPEETAADAAAVPRLSAVQSGPKRDQKAKPAAKARKPAKRAPKKAAAKKTVEPKTVEPEPAEPKVAEPEPVAWESSEPKSAKPETAEPETVEPTVDLDAAESKIAELEAAETNTADLEAAEANTAEVEAAEANTADPEGAGANTAEVEAAETNVAELETTAELETAELETAEPVDDTAPAMDGEEAPTSETEPASPSQVESEEEARESRRI
jgi:hypothetical protein